MTFVPHIMERLCIHSLRDFNEIQDLCGIYGTDDECWIGLSSLNSAGTTRGAFEYFNIDGTEWDVATNVDQSGNAFWHAGEPNDWEGGEKCAEMSFASSEWKLNDQACDEGNYPVCNMPSELCQPQNWDVYAQTVTFSDCGVVWDTTGASGVENIMLMRHKQWVNHGEMLIIEYMLAIDASSSDGRSGVIFGFVDVCNYYFAGVNIDVSGDATVSFGIVEGNLFSEYANSAYTVDSGTFYLLSIQISQNDASSVLYEVYVNDVLQLSSVNNDEIFHYRYDIFGPIGLLNDGSSITAKSLFVSGSYVYVADNADLHKCPTTNPTIDPTVDPTADPTLNPTIDPTLDPTFDPTSNPTQVPSRSPSTEPTHDPTVIPTSIPSSRPSHFTADVG